MRGEVNRSCDMRAISDAWRDRCSAPFGGICVCSSQFNTDLNEGQINLPSGVQCGWNGGQIATRDWRRLSRAMGTDPAKALSALLERGLVKVNAKATGRQIKVAENAIVRSRFNGSSRRYARALRAAKLARTTARQIIGDQLAEMAVAAKVRPQTYPVWLGGQENTALTTTTCLLDVIPTAGHVDLAKAFPLLRVAAPKTTAPRRHAA